MPETHVRAEQKAMLDDGFDEGGRGMRITGRLATAVEVASEVGQLTRMNAGGKKFEQGTCSSFLFPLPGTCLATLGSFNLLRSLRLI